MKVYGGAYNTQTRNEYMISDRFRKARTLVAGTTCIHLWLIWMKVYGGAYNTQTRNEYMISDRFRTARTLVGGTTRAMTTLHERARGNLQRSSRILPDPPSGKLTAIPVVGGVGVRVGGVVVVVGVGVRVGVGVGIGVGVLVARQGKKGRGRERQKERERGREGNRWLRLAGFWRVSDWFLTLQRDLCQLDFKAKAEIPRCTNGSGGAAAGVVVVLRVVASLVMRVRIHAWTHSISNLGA